MMHNLRQPLLVTSLAFAVTAIAFTSFRSLAGQETPFRVDTTWRLGGDGSWDYLAVDTAAHLLYIARLNRIMVVATRTRQWLGEIGNLEHAHGIAFDDEGKVGIHPRWRRRERRRL